MKVFLFAVVALAPAFALAGPKPLPGDQHDPKLIVDPGATYFEVISKDKTYGVHGLFIVNGASSEKDRLRMDWKAHGKVTPSKCDTRVHGSRISTLCEIDDNLKDAGPVDVDLVYSDDQTDKDYVVATYHLTIKSWKGIGKSMNWGFTPDDLLAVAYVRAVTGDTGLTTPHFEYWAAAKISGGDVTLRCTVDGKKIPDIDSPTDNAGIGAQNEIDNDVVTPSAQRYYQYKHIAIEPYGLYMGEKQKDQHYGEKSTFLIEHAGKWDCNVRRDGKVIRELLFTVNDKGMVEQGPLQDGKHPLALPDNVVLIDMRIPKDGGADARLRPDAMKKSIGFGVPWPDGSGAKAAQAAFPPASGTPD